jgi:hypothetical protein
MGRSAVTGLTKRNGFRAFTRGIVVAVTAALIFFVVTFLMIEVELRPASGSTHPGHASLNTVVALFVLFGGATFWMRWYFERRTKLKPPLAVSVEETEST